MSVATSGKSGAGAQESGTAREIELTSHQEDYPDEALKEPLPTGSPQAWRPVSTEEKKASRKLNRKLDLMVRLLFLQESPYEAGLTRADPSAPRNGIHVQPTR